MRRAVSPPLRARGCVAGALLALFGIAAGASNASAAAEPRGVDYLYVEANEGGSSGGHVALRLGADVFHFQQDRPGLIRLRRDNADAFDFHYAMLGNRAIHDTRLAVTDDTYALLRDTFARRLLVQTAQFERLDALSDDVALFERWPHTGAPPAAVPVRAAGYFAREMPAGGMAAGATSPAIAALRATVARQAGDDFIARRTAALRTALAAWQPRAVRAPAEPLSLDGYPSFPPTAATRYAEQLEGIAALEILAAAPPLRPDASRAAVTLAPLDQRERDRLAAFRQQLGADLAALAQSPQPDFGYPLLLGMARLAAIDASLASGRLVVLDAFALDAPAAQLPDGAERDRMLDALATQLRPTVERARQDLFASADFREADYTQLETTLNRFLEVEAARTNGTPVRTEMGLPLPARPAAREERIAAPLSDAAARSELAAARTAASAYRAQLGAVYGYNLLSRNCVSQIFATIDAALGTAAGASTVAEESRRRLGGVVSTGANLNFIPIVSARAVDRNYAALAYRTRPSYRELRLAAQAAAQPAWRVALRESNTLTATTYHPGPGDSAFLFFTAGAPPLRPLLGAANLLVGIGDGALGLVTWPRDGGRRLHAGLRGALFSLPELAFVNIRKGSTSWVEPELLEKPSTP